MFVVTAALAASAQLALAAGTIRLIKLQPLEVHPDAAATTRALDPLLAAAHASDISMFVGMAVLAVFLSRATLVVRALGGVHVRYGPRWALFGWLVPVWGWFVQKRVVDDLWRASVPVERLWSGTYPTAPRGSTAAFVGLYLGSFLVGIAGVPDGSATALLLASGLRLVSAVAGLVYVSGLLLRLERRALSLDLSARPARPAPQHARLATLLAAAAALVLLSGGVLGTARMIAVPGSLQNDATQPVAAADDTTGAPGAAGSGAGQQPQPYLLRTPRFSVQLASRPTTTVSQLKIAGLSATMTVYQVTTDTTQQDVMLYSLPAGDVFRSSPTDILALFSHAAHYTLVPSTTGTDGPYAYVDALPARGDSSDVGVRVLVHGATAIVLVSDPAHFPDLIDSFHIPAGHVQPAAPGGASQAKLPAGNAATGLQAGSRLS